MTSNFNLQESAKQAIREAILYLASRCDGAIKEDGVGFNGRDTEFGKSLARQIQAGGTLSVKRYECALKMLRTYRDTQLKGIVELPAPNTKFFASSTPVIKEKAPTDIVKKSANGENLMVFFEYSADKVAAIKTIKGAYFEGKATVKHWVVPSSNLIDLVEALEPFEFTYEQSILDILETIKAEQRLLEEETKEKIEWMADFIETKSWDWTWKPFNHQWETVDFFSRQPNNRFMICDEPGLGKTKSALMAALCGISYHDYVFGEDAALIIICPTTLKQNWIKEASHLNMQLEVYSYAKIPQAFSKPYFLIADEAHAFQNLKAQRTQKYLALAADDNCIGLVQLTATPMKNGQPKNLFPLLKAMGHSLGAKRKFFETRYCDAKVTAFSAWDTTGATNLDELNREISNKVLRRLKSECLDLPPKSIIEIECESIKELNDEFDRAFRAAKFEYECAVSDGEKSEKGKALVMMGLNRRLSSLYKVTEAIKMAEDILEQGQQVVIFTEFVESAEKIAEHFGVEALTGNTKQRCVIDGVETFPRQKMVDDFQSGVNRVFVGTIKAGGVGITLTASSYMILVDFPWTPGDVEQVEDRIHRIGSSAVNNVTIYHLYAKDIDYVVAMKIGQKVENISKVLKKYKLSPEQVSKMSLEEIAEKMFS